MNFFKRLMTEADNSTWCPLRVGGFIVLAVLVYYALHGIVNKTGDNFKDVATGFAYFLGAWGGSIGAKAIGRADSPPGSQN